MNINRVIFPLLFLIILVACKTENIKMKKVAEYKGKTIKTKNYESMGIMMAIQKEMIDLENFKKIHADMYEEIKNSVKEKYLYYENITKNNDKYKNELISNIEYVYDIQHIYVNSESDYNEIMSNMNKLSSFEGFSELAKIYSKEYATKDKGALLTNVDVFANKITTTLLYQFKDKELQTPFVAQDAYGYHIVRILKKTKKAIDPSYLSDQSIKGGVEDYIKYLYFKKLFKDYNVKYYYDNFDKFLNHPPNTPIMTIGDTIIRKIEFVDLIPKEYKDDPLFKVHAQTSSIAPLVDQVTRDILIKKEVKKQKDNKKIIIAADETFQDTIFFKWLDDASNKIDVSDLDPVIIEKVYKMKNFPDVDKTQFIMLHFDSMEQVYQVQSIVKDYKSYIKYASDMPTKVLYTPYLMDRDIPSDYEQFRPYLGEKEKTILKVMKLKNKYVIPMVNHKVTEPLIDYRTFFVSMQELVKQKRFYQMLLDTWHENKDLVLEKEVEELYVKLIVELEKSSDDLIKKAIEDNSTLTK